MSDEQLWNLAQSFGLSDEQIELVRLIRALRSQTEGMSIAFPCSVAIEVQSILRDCDRKLCPILDRLLEQSTSTESKTVRIAAG